MGTRCKIIVKDKYTTAAIYRHWDGYPEGVLPDIKVVLEKGLKRGLSDAEYFLANFIFMAKFSAWKRYEEKRKKGDEAFPGYLYTYGVCPPDCIHPDLEYIYEIDAEKNEIIIKEHKFSSGEWVVVFKGSLEEAFKKYVKEYEKGCHINAELFPDVEEY